MKTIILGIVILFSLHMTGQPDSGPEVMVASPNGNVIYRGIANRLDVMVEGQLCHEITIKATQGSISGEGCFYTINPGTEKLTSIRVFSIKGSDTTYVGKKDIRVKSLPEPRAHIYKKSSGRISKSLLIRGKIDAELGSRITPCPSGLGLTVTSFDMRILTDPCISYTAKGDRLSDEMIEAIESAQVGDVIRFENIESKMSHYISDCIPFELELQ